MDFILIYLLILIIPAIASYNIKNTYNKYKSLKNNRGITGFEVARKILDEHGLNNIYIVENPGGELSDCYDSSRKTVKLSHDVFHGETIAALAIAAHECGHAIQDKEGYAMLRIRSLIFPIVSIGTKIAYVMLVIGFFFQVFDLLLWAMGITALSLVFQLVTLPVEFNASERAKKILLEDGITTVDENVGVSKVLSSAALTYVAAVLSSLIQMAYYVLSYSRRR
jgi:Zn-dependent membrane protease YugP